MTETIITGIISAATAIVVCMVNHNKTIALIEYKLDTLQKTVEKHNNVVERMAIVEKDIDCIKDEIDDMKK